MSELELGHLEVKDEQPRNLFYKVIEAQGELKPLTEPTYFYTAQMLEEEKRKAFKRGWDSGYMNALKELREKSRDMADYIEDLILAMLTLPEGDEDERQG